MQHEITERGPLLDENGDLREPGYARRLLLTYRRGDIKAPGLRVKEWDYYCVMNDRFALALTVADNGYMGLDSISLVDLENRKQITKSPVRLLPLGRTGLPESTMAGDVHSAGPGYSLYFKNDAVKRTLVAQMRNFGREGSLYAKIELTEEPAESMVIATPFDKPGHFYYNQKINCLRARGEVVYGYNNKVWRFDPEDSFAVLDWGRGVWTYHNTWYWGSASGLVDGVPFGFNLGYGFGDTAAATENMLFYGGKAHKLSRVDFHIPKMKNGKNNYLSPWRIDGDDGRLELDFLPVVDRAARAGAVVLKSDQHQVFGRFTGKAVLDDGTVLQIRNLMGFAERVENKW